MEKQTIEVSDGSKMQICFQAAKNSSGRGLLILQEAFGVNAHIEDLVRRFSDLGFFALAPELYHRTAPVGFTCDYNDFSKAKPHLDALTEKGQQDDVRASLQWLANRDVTKVAAVGYCMGGASAFIANADSGLSCAISYYGSRVATSARHLASEQRSPLLFFWAGLDKHTAGKQILEVNEALKEHKKRFVSVEISDADHGFNCDDRPVFNKMAAEQSLALSLKFLENHMQ